MSKKRTKEQKMTAKRHYVTEVDKKPTDSIESLYTYDPIYLQRDLRRTLILSMLILAVQIGLYIWLR